MRERQGNMGGKYWRSPGIQMKESVRERETVSEREETREQT